MTNETKRLLRNLARIDPEAFNKLEYDMKFVAFKEVFNEYVKKVAIPKQWEFTKTLKHWPDGTGEGEGISEDGRVWYDEERAKLIHDVLDYPDLILFAMENYGLLLDNYLIPNKEDKTGPPAMALHLEKIPKAEALSMCRAIRKEFRKYQESRPPTEKWDEKELTEDSVFDAIDNMHKLSREQKIRLQAYITYKFAEKVGIPVPQHHDDRALTTDIQKVIKDNEWTIMQVWKRKNEFRWFCLGHYGVVPSFGKNAKGKQTMSMARVPDKVLDKMLDVLKSGKDLTDAELNELRREIDEERDAKSKDPKE